MIPAAKEQPIFTDIPIKAPRESAIVRPTASGVGNPATVAIIAEAYTAGNAAKIPPIRPPNFLPIKVAQATAEPPIKNRITKPVNVNPSTSPVFDTLHYPELINGREIHAR